VPTSFAPEVPAGHPTILPLPRCWQGTCAGLADKVGAACGSGTVCDAAAYKLALAQFRWPRPTSAAECPLTCCLQDPTKSGKAVGNCPASLDQYLGTGPFEGMLDIMMTGDDATVGYCGGGVTAKGHMGKFNTGRIVRVDGEVSLHGKRPSNTWSWLRETAGSGASRLVVQGRQDWTVGDEVLVATTSDSEAQTEERTVQVCYLVITSSTLCRAGRGVADPNANPNANPYYRPRRGCLRPVRAVRRRASTRS